MRSKFAFALVVFVIGYSVGRGHVPSGMEFLFGTFLAFMSGVKTCIWASKCRAMLREWRGSVITLLGYTVSLKRAVEVIQESEKVTPIKKVQEKAAECDFCHGEELFIAGKKQPMPCPKCKKDKKRA